MAEGSATLYECTNEGCSLGKVGEPGHFTGGITAEQVNLLTGTPVEALEEGTDYGEGVCTNCGTKGAAVGEHTYDANAGTDPTEGEDPMPARLNALAELAGLTKNSTTPDKDTSGVVWGEKQNA